MKMTLFNLLFFFLAQFGAGAQNGALVTKNFKFADGVYRSHEELRKNMPTIQWDSMSANLFTNPQTLLMQVEYLRYRNSRRPIGLDSIQYVVVDGIPYVHLPKFAAKKLSETFVGLIARGKICYFGYETTDTLKVPISAFNPLTGKPYMTQKVDTEKRKVHEKLLLFETGEVKDFTLQNFKNWISDDQKLLKSVEGMTRQEIREKLFKTLLIYDDRNPVYTSK